MFRALSPLLERLGECGSCVVYKMGVGLEGREGGGGLRHKFPGVLWGEGGSGGLLSRGKNAIKSLKASHNQSL